MLIKKYVYHLHSRDAAAPSLASAWQLLFMRCLLNFHFLNEISATRGRRRGRGLVWMGVPLHPKVNAGDSSLSSFHFAVFFFTVVVAVAAVAAVLSAHVAGSC